jgi:hypothetical protein
MNHAEPARMIIQSPQLRTIPSFLLPFTQPRIASQARCLQVRVRATRIPRPTPFVPDAQTFLTLIGRNLSQHASKIPSWKALFSLTSAQLKELGVEPPRSRRYLLRWREKFRNGQYGVGGDLKYVDHGEAQVRVVEVPASVSSPATTTASSNKRKIVVNVDAGGSVLEKSAEQLVSVKDLHIKGAQTIVGPRVQPVKGGRGAKIVVTEGLWEDRRGHKIDGGERRQAEVRAKRRGEERRAAR